mmetsp:Transcript_8670/g.19844  ORF Transcript_8670/g.19844 Transcript_8670/m.19844 type:complete len:262 (-) Transcript_8670:482-1267(-)
MPVEKKLAVFFELVIQFVLDLLRRYSSALATGLHASCVRDVLLGLVLEKVPQLALSPHHLHEAGAPALVDAIIQHALHPLELHTTPFRRLLHRFNSSNGPSLRNLSAQAGTSLRFCFGSSLGGLPHMVRQRCEVHVQLGQTRCKEPLVVGVHLRQSCLGCVVGLFAQLAVLVLPHLLRRKHVGRPSKKTWDSVGHHGQRLLEFFEDSNHRVLVQVRDRALNGALVPLCGGTEVEAHRKHVELVHELCSIRVCGELYQRRRP